MAAHSPCEPLLARARLRVATRRLRAQAHVIKLGKLELATRMAMAPLTRSRADDNLVPNDMVVEYYSR